MSAPKVYLELAGRRFPVPYGTSTLGRSRRCEVVIPDPSISRSHALISVAGGRITLKDLESSNGTFINGRRLTGEAEIADGDLLGLGETEVRLRVEHPEEDLGAYTVRIPVAAIGRPEPERSLTASEAIGVGDVLPVGEVLAQSSPSWDRTGVVPVPRANKAAQAPPAAEAPAAVHPGPWKPAALDQAPAAGPAPAPLAPRVPAPPPAAPRRLGPPSPRLASPDSAPAAAPRRVVPPPAAPAPQRLAEPAPAPAARRVAPPPEPPPALPPASAEVLPSIEDVERPGGQPPLPHHEAAEARRAFLPPAGFWVRGAALLFDALLIAVLGLAASFAAGGPVAPTGGLLGSATMLALGLLVPVVGWSAWATTPGKRLLGLYVCDREGRVGISVGRALVRWIAYLASALPLGLGFLLAGLNTDRRALHDYLARTYVGRRA